MNNIEIEVVCAEERLKQFCKRTDLEEPKIQDYPVPTPSLKETLFENIDKAMEGKAASEFERGFDEGLEVAKLIINRLMP